MRKYDDGYTLDEMVERVVYWWRRYLGTRVEGGKEYSKSDIEILSRRVKKLSEKPDKFKFNHPDMGIDDHGWENE